MFYGLSTIFHGLSTVFLRFVYDFPTIVIGIMIGIMMGIMIGIMMGIIGIIGKIIKTKTYALKPKENVEKP